MGRSDKGRSRSRSRDRKKDKERDHKKKDKKEKKEKKDKKTQKSAGFDFNNLSSLGIGSSSWADGPATYKIRDEQGNIIEEALLPAGDG